MRSSYQIEIKGLVQGIGFRPMILRTAKKFGLTGKVRNNATGLSICINSNDKDEANRFLQALIGNKPALARIDKYSLSETQYYPYDSFFIDKSGTHQKSTALIGPDLAICDNCTSEISNSKDRRYNYPFVSCHDCGPRFSIQKAIPFERHLTKMRKFDLCETCKIEFTDPDNRRFHAQTISCPDCGIKISIRTQYGSVILNSNRDYIAKINSLLFDESKVLAIKGVGGFLLIADATKKDLIRRIRHIKQRPYKPLALMYADIEAVHNDFILNSDQIEILESPARPILLLPGSESKFNLDVDLIAPGLSHIGVMLPSSGLLHLILAGSSNSIIATSGNITHSPIGYKFVKETGIFSQVDYIIDHNLPIHFPQDDSLVKLSPKYNTPILLRRSRGFAPMFNTPVFLRESKEEKLALGADIKSSFCAQQGGSIYVSQSFGDLIHLENHNRFLEVLSKLRMLTGNEPNAILCDLHPNYVSGRIAEKIANEEHITLKKIQHHKAHFAAVMAENDLFNRQNDVLGFIWDGMGYGEDGSIWGSETFAWQDGKMIRVAHLDYYTNLAGSKMAREPRIAAMSLFYAVPEAMSLIKPFFTDLEWNAYTRFLNAESTILTSSMGRLFDAVAAILNLGMINNYEGECAIKLEEKAMSFLENNPIPEPYDISIESGKILIRPMLLSISKDIIKGKDSHEIAARFHVSLAYLIEQIADEYGIKCLAFSGGVFQNGVLVDLAKTLLSDKYELYFHIHLSPNDECISFGQIAYDLMHE